MVSDREELLLQLAREDFFREFNAYIREREPEKQELLEAIARGKKGLWYSMRLPKAKITTVLTAYDPRFDKNVSSRITVVHDGLDMDNIENILVSMGELPENYELRTYIQNAGAPTYMQQYYSATNLENEKVSALNIVTYNELHNPSNFIGMLHPTAFGGYFAKPDTGIIFPMDIYSQRPFIENIDSSAPRIMKKYFDDLEGNAIAYLKKNSVNFVLGKMGHKIRA